MDILIISFITLLGLICNCFNMIIFLNKRMKKITTFRYFFHLAWIDMIWLIIWLLHKLISSGKIILPQTMMNNYHSNLIYRFIVFLYNYFTQMNNWMFMAANLNKAILIVNEFKHKQLNKCIHNKILISISII